MNESVVIRTMVAEDWESVRSIYEEGIQTGNATFQQTAPSWVEWDQSHVKELRYVACMNEQVLGWVALSPTSSRCIYQGVAEVSIYISEIARGNGIGSKLLKILIDDSEEKGYWTLQAVIFPENISSLHLYKNFGFIEVGQRVRIGQLNGVWRDVLLMERRSNKVGID